MDLTGTGCGRLQLGQNRVQRQDLANVVMNLVVPQKAGIFKT
jgi:hypothetical protein